MNLYSIFLKNIQLEKRVITEKTEYSYGEIYNFIENTSKIINKSKKMKKYFLFQITFFLI